MYNQVEYEALKALHQLFLRVIPKRSQAGAARSEAGTLQQNPSWITLLTIALGGGR
jgi:hypothetical protein